MTDLTSGRMIVFVCAIINFYIVCWLGHLLGDSWIWTPTFILDTLLEFFFILLLAVSFED